MLQDLRRGDYRNDFEFKSEVVRRLSQKYRIVAVFEDSKPVAEALECYTGS